MSLEQIRARVILADKINAAAGDNFHLTEEAEDRKALLNALDAVLALHKPYAICDECECPDGTHPEEYEYLDCLDYNGCDNSILGWACGECCSDTMGYNTEDCADSHKHDMDKTKRCPTVTALTDALEAQL